MLKPQEGTVTVESAEFTVISGRILYEVLRLCYGAWDAHRDRPAKDDAAVLGISGLLPRDSISA